MQWLEKGKFFYYSTTISCHNNQPFLSLDLVSITIPFANQFYLTFADIPCLISAGRQNIWGTSIENNSAHFSRPDHSRHFFFQSEKWNIYLPLLRFWNLASEPCMSNCKGQGRHMSEKHEFLVSAILKQAHKLHRFLIPSSLWDHCCLLWRALLWPTKAAHENRLFQREISFDLHKTLIWRTTTALQPFQGC